MNPMCNVIFTFLNIDLRPALNAQNDFTSLCFHSKVFCSVTVEGYQVLCLMTSHRPHLLFIHSLIHLFIPFVSYTRGRGIHTHAEFYPTTCNSLKTTVFWDAPPCSLVDTDRCLRCAMVDDRSSDGGSNKYLKSLAVSTRLHSAKTQDQQSSYSSP
jgi:hypothetical protein